MDFQNFNIAFKDLSNDICQTPCTFSGLKLHLGCINIFFVIGMKFCKILQVNSICKGYILRSVGEPEPEPGAGEPKAETFYWDR